MTERKIDIEDLLCDDPQIYNQKFFVLSYILPGKNNELKNPLIKMRGAFKTYEDAEKRVELLKRTDKHFNIYIAPVGTWGNLLDDEELLKSDEVDTVYREEQLNEIFTKYKENKLKAQEEHERRKELLHRKALEEAKPVFQKYLSFCDEATRGYLVPQTTTIEKFDEFKKTIKNVTAYLEFFRVLRSCESSYYLAYRENETPQEELEKEIQEKLKTFF